MSEASSLTAIVSAAFTRAEKAALREYCKREAITVSEFIRRTVLNVMSETNG